MVAEDTYVWGNTVVLDHGYGIHAVRAPFRDRCKARGLVENNAEIGKVGATGHVTGPHLHWGLTVQHARVNAMQIVQRQP